MLRWFKFHQKNVSTINFHVRVPILPKSTRLPFRFFVVASLRPTTNAFHQATPAEAVLHTMHPPPQHAERV